MFHHIFKSKSQNSRNNDSVYAIISQTEALIENLYSRIDVRFQELSGQIKELEQGLQNLETKLLAKDLKDKQAYGLLHYKLHEVKNVKLQKEIDELQEKLSQIEINPIEY